MKASDVQEGDVVFYHDNGVYCRKVVSTTARHISVNQPRGFRPKTKRISRNKILEVWRWHKAL